VPVGVMSGDGASFFSSSGCRISTTKAAARPAVIDVKAKENSFRNSMDTHNLSIQTEKPVVVLGDK